MGLFDAIASVINTGYNVSSQRKTNNDNLQQQWDMWNATNEYNHPAAQMARYREAGLNPNLIYGQSNTTSASTVGTAVAPQASLSGFDGILQDFANLTMMKEKIEEQKMNNEILDYSLNEYKRRASLENANIESDTSLKGSQANMFDSQTNLNNSLKNKVEAEIEKIGFENTLLKQQEQLNQFKIDDLPRLKKILDNELKISDESVSQARIKTLSDDKQLELLDANVKLAEFSLYLDQMEYALKAAMTDETLSRIGLNETQAQKLLSDIEVNQKEIEKMASDISVNNVKKGKMMSDVLSDWFGNFFSSSGEKSEFTLFKLLKALIK